MREVCLFVYVYDPTDINAARAVMRYCVVSQILCRNRDVVLARINCKPNRIHYTLTLTPKPETLTRTPKPYRVPCAAPRPLTLHPNP